MINARRRILRFLRSHPRIKIGFMLSPCACWIIGFTLLPMIFILYYSFQTRGPWGTIKYEFNFHNYGEIFDPIFLKVFFRSLYLSSITVIFCLFGGYTVAYWIAFYGKKFKSILLFLVVLPFCTSYLVRIYSWVTILSDHGIVNSLLTFFEIIENPLPLLHNQFAVVIGLVYTYLPFMILPLYASIERLDRSVLEAASDLGAHSLERFYKITIPLTKGGMLSGSVLVFVPAIGEFLVPELLGGAKVMMLGKFISLKFVGLRDWPLGSAYSIVILILVLILLYLYMQIFGGKQAFQE